MGQMDTSEDAEELAKKVRSPEFQERIGDWKKLLRGTKTELLPVKISPPYCSDAFSPKQDFSGKIACLPDGNLMDCVEFHLEFPSSVSITPEAAEAFLLSISRIELPAAFVTPRIVFELMGIGGRVNFQIACDEMARTSVKAAIREFFPDVIIREERDCLRRQLNSLPEDYPIFKLDHGLSRDFVLPIKTHQTFEEDPLEEIIRQLAILGENEFGLLQILLIRADNIWQDTVRKMLISDNPLPVEQVFDLGSGGRGLIKKKISKPFFAAAIRVAGRAKDGKRAADIAKTLSLFLRQRSEDNSLDAFLHGAWSEEQDSRMHGLLRRASWQSGALLNSEELAPLARIPFGPRARRHLRMVPAKTKPVLAKYVFPESGEQDGVLIGVNQHRKNSECVCLRTEQRTRHTYVIGVSGMGKSTMLLGLILQDLARGNGVAVLDPHGDLIEKVLERIPEKRLKDVVLFDPADEEYPIGFNILSAHSELEKNLLASDLVAVFRRFSTAWGDQMNSVLANAILAFLESDRGGTLLDVRRFLVDKDFRQEFLTTVKDEQVVYYWKKEFPMLSGKPQGPILTRLDAFLRPKLIRHMVAQKQNRLNFAEMMDQGKIFLGNLAQGAIGEENSHLLGSLLVSKFHQVAFSRQQQKAHERRPFYLYLDEFHNFITPSMASLLSGGRKYGLGLTMAHQELRQLWNRDADVASAVLANSCARVCFRLGEWDAQKLAEGFSFFDAKDLQGLGAGQAICRIDTPEQDFNLVTLPWESLSENQGDEWKKKIRELSRKQHGSPKEQVLEELREKKEPAPEADIPQPRKKEKIEESRPPLAKDISAKHVDDCVKPPALKATPGRGGQQHKYLQNLFKQSAEAKGYRAEVEKAVLEGAGSVDLALEKNGKTIAIEISITTSPEHELGNIEKCLASRFEKVFLISPELMTLQKLRALAEARWKEEMARIFFMVPADFLMLLEQEEADAAGTEGAVKGWNVKKNLRALSGDEKESRKQNIAQTILKALKRLKGG